MSPKFESLPQQKQEEESSFSRIEKNADALLEKTNDELDDYLEAMRRVRDNQGPEELAKAIKTNLLSNPFLRRVILEKKSHISEQAEKGDALAEKQVQDLDKFYNELS